MNREMDVDIQTYFGESLADEIAVLGEFRLRYFREFPYLYAGTEEGEQSHLAEYIAQPSARLSIAREKGKIIGVAIGTMLSAEMEILRQAGESLRQLEIVPSQYYYFGEMVLMPEYRRYGIGKRMLKVLKDAGREQGVNQFCFLSVAREIDDVRRPVEYVDSEVIFHKFGFEKTDVSVSFEWATIQADGSIEKVANRLDFWVAHLR